MSARLIVSAGTHASLLSPVYHRTRPLNEQWHFLAQWPAAFRPMDRPVPRAPLPGGSVTSAGAMSCIASKGVTLSSLLLRAHAPARLPFRLLQPWPRLADLCRLLPVLAESGAFPTLSPRDLAWMSGPLPRWDMECSCSLLPPYRRPSPTGNGSASHEFPPDDFLVSAVFEAAVIP
jgi:hypothetical protein